jgi:hypothetical protein
MTFHDRYHANLFNLPPLASNAASELHVLGQDSHTFVVPRTCVRLREEGLKEGLRRLLRCEYGVRLEAQVGIKGVRDLDHEPLAGKPANNRLGRFMQRPDLTNLYNGRTVPVLFVGYHLKNRF